jgi:hypothetical protein
MSALEKSLTTLNSLSNVTVPETAQSEQVTRYVAHYGRRSQIRLT